MRLLVVSLVLTCRLARAAPNDAQIRGTLLDPAGVPVQFTALTLVPGETKSRIVVRTGSDGEYEASGLEAGSYTITAGIVDGDSFARVVVILQPGQHLELPIRLSSLWESVEGVAAGFNLPLNGRGYVETVWGIAGITTGDDGENLAGHGPYRSDTDIGFNSNGMRKQANGYLLDGADNSNSWTGDELLTPSLDSLQTVDVSSTYVPAALGHTGGAVVDADSRSGQNQIHGSAFEYFQDSFLRARNFFDGAYTPAFSSNQFGGSLGGALRRDRTFFFLSAESACGTEGLTVTSTVPTAADRAGVFSSMPIYDPLSPQAAVSGGLIRLPFPQSQIPVSLIPPQAYNLLQFYPLPNLPGLSNNFRFTPQGHSMDDRFGLRTDHRLSDRSALLLRLSLQKQEQTSPGALPAPSNLPASEVPYAGSDVAQFADDDDVRTTAWNGELAHNLVLTPRLLNAVRVGITGYDLNAQPLDSAFDAAALGIPGLGEGGLPSITPLGYAALGAAGPVPLKIHLESFELRDLATANLGRHTWTIGVQAIRRIANADASDITSRGSFLFTPDYTSLAGVSDTGNSVASLLLGYPTEVQRDIQFTDYRLRGWEEDFFVQDEVHIGRRFTLEAGLHYSFLPPVTEADDHLVNFNFSHSAAALDAFAGQNGVSSGAGRRYNALAFAPRAGFAFDLTGSGSNVLRGGFSTTFYPASYLVQGVLARNEPWAAQQDLFSGSLLLGPSLATGLPAVVPMPLATPQALNRAGFDIYAMETKPVTPYSEQWGLIVQHRFDARWTIELGGTSSMGIHLPAEYDVNQPANGPGSLLPRRQLWGVPQLSRIEYMSFAGGSTYYGGQVRLAGRVTRGLQTTASWNYGKAEDDSSEPFSGQQSRPWIPQNSYSSQRALSSFDIASRFFMTFSYEIPSAGGRWKGPFSHWQLDGVVTAQSGMPFTPELAANVSNDGGPQLPDRVGSGSLPASQRSPLRWFNTSLDTTGRAFVTPPLFSFGDSGYDILRGPGLASVDAALSRRLALGERLRLWLRAEAFNALNQTNLALPNRILGLDSSGSINHTSTAARQIQLVTRLEW
jgi:hypothetical protein